MPAIWIIRGWNSIGRRCAGMSVTIGVLAALTVLGAAGVVL